MSGTIVVAAVAIAVLMCIGVLIERGIRRSRLALKEAREQRAELERAQRAAEDDNASA